MNHWKKQLAIVVVAICGLAMSPVQVQALSTPLLTLNTNGSGVGYPAGITVGYTFSLTEAKTVTHLGIFDLGGDGLLESH